MQPIEVTWHDTDIAVVTLYGEHDATTARLLARTLRSSTYAGDLVIVDLSQVEFIDSAVIHTLLEGDRLARERHSFLTLQVGTAAIVRKVLEITGITDELACAGSRENAIRIARDRRYGDLPRHGPGRRGHLRRNALDRVGSQRDAPPGS